MLSQNLRYFLSKSPLRKVQLFVCAKLYVLVELLVYSIVRKYYAKALLKVPPGTQLFLITRLELGTSITQLHYVSYWHHYRAPSTVVILSSRYRLIQNVAQSVCPEVPVICFDSAWLRMLIFFCGHPTVHSALYGKIYGRLVADCPSALYIYECTSGMFRCKSQGTTYHTSNYIKGFDTHLQQLRGTVSPEFLNAYLNIRQCYDYRLELYVDYIRLYTEQTPKVPVMKLKQKSILLQKSLSIEGKYVVMNLNCKDNFSDPHLNRRKIQDPHRYNCLIDFLIERGYSVVLQGREEQPRFEPRKKLVDYTRSPFCSVEGDFALYAGAAFAISTKSGTEYFGPVCDIPLLALELTELCCMAANVKNRYYPKRIRCKLSNKPISWEKILELPCFFDIGPIAHDPNIVYANMTEEEILEAAEEFLCLVETPGTDWMKFSPLQLAYKAKLNPLHLDSYYIPSVPCNSYLLTPRLIS